MGQGAFAMFVIGWTLGVLEVRVDVRCVVWEGQLMWCRYVEREDEYSG